MALWVSCAERQRVALRRERRVGRRGSNAAVAAIVGANGLHRPCRSATAQHRAEPPVRRGILKGEESERCSGYQRAGYQLSISSLSRREETGPAGWVGAERGKHLRV